MKQPRKFYIYSRSSMYFLIFLAVSMLIAVIQLLLEDNFFEKLQVLLAALSLLVTVGWIAFSSMGRIEIRNTEIVVDRNFKRYRLNPLTIVVRLGEKDSSRGITNYPIYVEGNVVGHGTPGRSITLKFLGTKRKNKELLKYYQEHLQAQVEANRALEQEPTEVNFEQIVLASKERQQFPLRDLVEFGADQGNLKKTVFYHPKENKLYVGKSVPFPIIFTPSGILFYGIYLLTDRVSFHGFIPLVLSFGLMFVIAIGQLKRRRQKYTVNVIPYEIPEHYFQVQKSNGLKTYLLILVFGLITLGLSILYLTFGSFLLLFISFLMWYFFVLLTLCGQFKKTHYLKILEKK
ncbi:hypothetical protein [Streptococcus parasanguinis]|uniref:hypothetical protein n=1 Tax=Streptococcus parasanguinis TaxID=1318 RepID=UPI0034A2CB5B